MKVLVVDDHSESRKYLRYMLEGHECEVVEAADGMEGLAMVRAGKPDLIISDSLMPNMDGFQMLMELKREGPARDIPFIFYSGNYISGQDSALALSLGACAYLLKPQQPWQLWQKIQECMGTGSQTKGGPFTENGEYQEYLKQYGRVVASKLEEKIRELEAEVAQRREAEKRLHALSDSMFKKLELERRHIARELHDDVGQSLTVLKMNLQTIRRMPESGSCSSLLDDSISSVERAIKNIRNLSVDLRPSVLDDLGLVSAIRWYVDKTAPAAGLKAVFSMDEFEERLPFEIETACFRIFQEALTNIIKHANAATVVIELLKREDSIEMAVTDDGVSFDMQAAYAGAVKGESFGILSMQERAMLAGGKLEIESMPGRGTSVRVSFPLERH